MSTEVNLENNFSFSTQGKYCQEINGAQSLWFYFERSKHVTVTVLISHLFLHEKARVSLFLVSVQDLHFRDPEFCNICILKNYLQQYLSQCLLCHLSFFPSAGEGHCVTSRDVLYPERSADSNPESQED